MNITKDMLIAIDSGMQECNTTAAFAWECRDAAYSAEKVTKSFEDYGISTRGEQVALLSLMMLESGNFSYERNQLSGILLCYE